MLRSSMKIIHHSCSKVFVSHVVVAVYNDDDDDDDDDDNRFHELCRVILATHHLYQFVESKSRPLEIDDPESSFDHFLS